MLSKCLYAKEFGETVGWVIDSRNSRQDKLICFRPIQKCKIFKIKVEGATCWLTDVSHGNDCCIVFIKLGCMSLWNREVIKDVTKV